MKHRRRERTRVSEARLPTADDKEGTRLYITEKRTRSLMWRASVEIQDRSTQSIALSGKERKQRANTIRDRSARKGRVGWERGPLLKWEHPAGLGRGVGPGGLWGAGTERKGGWNFRAFPR